MSGVRAAQSSPRARILGRAAALLGLLFVGIAVSTFRQSLTGISRHGLIRDVFLYQSRMADEVMDRLATLQLEGNPNPDPELAARDAHMAKVCRFLNAAAVAEAEYRAPGWRIELGAFASARACARAAGAVDARLHSTGTHLEERERR